MLGKGLRRSLLALIALMTVANGAKMLFDGRGWYDAVPGVQDTGPYNPHFVQDIGLAFIVASGGLFTTAWRPALWPAAVTGAAFLVAHAGLHLVGIAQGMTHHAGMELGLLVAPAFIALWAAFASKEVAHA